MTFCHAQTKRSLKKIQAIYFKIQGTYFKIYGLYFLGDALCFSTLQKHGKSCPLPSLYQRLHFINF